MTATHIGVGIMAILIAITVGMLLLLAYQGLRMSWLKSKLVHHPNRTYPFMPRDVLLKYCTFHFEATSVTGEHIHIAEEHVLRMYHVTGMLDPNHPIKCWATMASVFPQCSIYLVLRTCTDFERWAVTRVCHHELGGHNPDATYRLVFGKHARLKWH